MYTHDSPERHPKYPANLLRKDDKGRLVPSRFGGGSFDALKHEPLSLKRQDSFYSQLLAALSEIRASDKPHRTADEITAFFNTKHDQKKSVATVTKILSRCLVWSFLDYLEKPHDKRGGFWALKADIDVNNVDDLLIRAKTAGRLLGSLTDECVATIANGAVTK